MGLIQIPLKAVESPQEGKAGILFLLWKPTEEISTSANFFLSTRKYQEKKIWP